MMRCSCHGLHGCVPAPPSAIPTPEARRTSCPRRSPSRARASANVSQRPVRISTSEAMSSPTRCSSSSVPTAAACSSSKRFVRSSESGSRSANSSSTASVKSCVESKLSRARRICSSGGSRCASPIRRRLCEGLQQPARDAGPAPAGDGGSARGSAQQRPLVRRELEQRAQLGSEVARVARREPCERAPLGRIDLLHTCRDLGQPGVPGDERRATRGGGLGRDHAERLGKDRRHHGHVGERQQVDEMAVLERAGEERPRRRYPLELVPVVAEPDDDGARVDIAERPEEEVHALVAEELADVDDGGLVVGEERGETLGVALVGETLLTISGVGRVTPALLDEAGERLVARLGRKLVHIDSRRDLVHTVEVAEDVLEHRADVRRADEDGLRFGERGVCLVLELGSTAKRVLELGTVHLDREAGSGGGRNGAARQGMVREYEIGRQLRGERGGVALDVALTLVARERLEEPWLEPLVAVEDEDRKHTADVGPPRLGAAEVVSLGPRVLAEDDDVVPGAAPFPRDRPGVDVRPGAVEQVAVPEQDPHQAPRPRPRSGRRTFDTIAFTIRATFPTRLESGGGTRVAPAREAVQARWKYNACSSSTAGFEVCTWTSAGTSSSASE